MTLSAKLWIAWGPWVDTFAQIRESMLGFLYIEKPENYLKASKSAVFRLVYTFANRFRFSQKTLSVLYMRLTLFTNKAGIPVVDLYKSIHRTPNSWGNLTLFGVILELSGTFRYSKSRKNPE
ncbi:hypothetical protein EGO53_24030 [Serratia liquefaciens]|uniref:Uncharacterized protein n=1 Tax=Serratia liquefaciens TaxID=614 RepID=A0A515D2L2_SERLI|nr:hypothetical protein EGO53_24030 [Serratia liquefaciens]